MRKALSRYKSRVKKFGMSATTEAIIGAIVPCAPGGKRDAACGCETRDGGDIKLDRSFRVPPGSAGDKTTASGSCIVDQDANLVVVHAAVSQLWPRRLNW